MRSGVHLKERVPSSKRHGSTAWTSVALPPTTNWSSRDLQKEGSPARPFHISIAREIFPVQPPLLPSLTTSWLLLQERRAQSLKYFNVGQPPSSMLRPLLFLLWNFDPWMDSLTCSTDPSLPSSCAISISTSYCHTPPHPHSVCISLQPPSSLFALIPSPDSRK